MRKIAILNFVAFAALVFSMCALAGSHEVEYGKLPKWVIASPAPTGTASLPNSSFQVIYKDIQINISNKGTETYTAFRLKILKPEALEMGNITLTWQPDAGGVCIHILRVIRDGKSIDVLKQSKFKVIQREQNLERSLFDGALTASLQVPGLQVGDEIEVATTITQKDPTLGNEASGVAFLPSNGLPGAFRILLTWPQNRKLKWAVTKDMGTLAPMTEKGKSRILLELRDAPASISTDGAPARYNLRRMLEYSEFQSWPEVSAKLAPLYQRAERLTAASPLHEEIRKIAASTADPIHRAESALRLVEDQIRYVYIGMNGGNLIPAAVDETWQRRFGDCKAKTALLLALLHGLGIDAVPMIVDLSGGDGINERLPSPGWFNHVVVRAVINGQTFYLDGTRMGDRAIDLLPQPAFRWGLPIRLEGAQLEAIPTPPSKIPDIVTVLDIDATAGLIEDAKINVRQILRGDSAIKTRAILNAASPDYAEQIMKEYWKSKDSWINVNSVRWRYDENTGSVELSAKGTAKMEWSNQSDGGSRLDIPGAGFTPPAEYHRPKEQEQEAPWSIEYPFYRCWATIIRLPPPESNWAWDYFATSENVQMGGINYYRMASLTGNVMRTVMSKHSLGPEISAADAAQVNKDLATFNNSISYVDEEPKKPNVVYRNEFPVFTDDFEWLKSFSPCEASQK